LVTLDVPIYCTDGGSRHDFIAFLKDLPNCTVLQTTGKGVWAQAKNSLLEGYQSGAEFILYTEPDKKEFFKRGLPEMLNNVLIDEETGIITASRSIEGLSSFPDFQQMTETTINNCCVEITGNKFDYTYGPFLMNRKLVPYLNLIQADIGWGWRPYTFGIAKRLGFKVEAFVGDFMCPEDQRGDDHKERIYRMKQLHQNIEGIVLSTTVSLEVV